MNSIQNLDELYMRRCIELAQNARSEVAPNPKVGAVIVHQGKIIGEGFHQKYGQAHAEVNAINSVADHLLLAESTIYVSLEPCAHFGKTPPCADLLIHHRFQRVVIGCVDPFPSVAGKGIERLKNAGITVDVGILEKECRELNRMFFVSNTFKRPYITLKWAQTKNGFIDQDRSNNHKGIHWISSPEAKPFVHQLRSEHQAILVGKNTLLNDNPSLTVREVSGKNPIRIVIDRQLELDLSSAIFSKDAETWILNEIKTDQLEHLSYFQLTDFSLTSILEFLHSHHIQSLFVEGGKVVLNQFLDLGIWDETVVIQGETVFQSGNKAPKMPSEIQFTQTKLGSNWVYHFKKPICF